MLWSVKCCFNEDKADDAEEAVRRMVEDEVI
jgi:pentatricopeptide repeat protein